MTELDRLRSEVRALRAERDELAKVIDDTESHYGLSSNGNMWRFWSDKAREIAGNNKELRADRDRLAAANAALEAQVARLVGALEPFRLMSGELFARNWNASDVVIALDNPGDPHRLTFGDFLELHAALAAVQADARREGGE